MQIVILMSNEESRIDYLRVNDNTGERTRCIEDCNLPRRFVFSLSRSLLTVYRWRRENQYLLTLLEDAGHTLIDCLFLLLLLHHQHSPVYEPNRLPLRIILLLLFLFVQLLLSCAADFLLVDDDRFRVCTRRKRRYTFSLFRLFFSSISSDAKERKRERESERDKQPRWSVKLLHTWRRQVSCCIDRFHFLYTCGWVFGLWSICHNRQHRIWTRSFLLPTLEHFSIRFWIKRRLRTIIIIQHR